jgi:hypothetical protein
MGASRARGGAIWQAIKTRWERLLTSSCLEEVDEDGQVSRIVIMWAAFPDARYLVLPASQDDEATVTRDNAEHK